MHYYLFECHDALSLGGGCTDQPLDWLVIFYWRRVLLGGLLARGVREAPNYETLLGEGFLVLELVRVTTRTA